MLKLFLLRHAQATDDYNVDDYQRPLTLHGINQARSIAAALPKIRLTLCSPALRTKMTLDTMNKEKTTTQQIIHADTLYNAPAGNLLTALQNCDDEETLLLIAHNPGIHQLANILSAEDDSQKREALRYSYAPATLSVLECPIEKWKDLKPAKNTLIDLVIPNL